MRKKLSPDGPSCDLGLFSLSHGSSFDATGLNWVSALFLEQGELLS